MRILLNGRGGKVGSVLGPSLEEAGHELVGIEAAQVMIDFTHPDAALAADLLRLDRLSAAGIGPSESRFRAAIECVNPALVERAAA